MSAYIEQLEISNFKSVRNLKLDCERVNVFIGKPNAGKSNILEAISLLGAGFSVQSGSFMNDFIRYKDIIQLFTNFDIEKSIEVKTNHFNGVLSYKTNNHSFNFNLSILNGNSNTNANLEGKTINPQSLNVNIQKNGQAGFSYDQIENFQSVKKYEFKSIDSSIQRDYFLYPPYGDNFYSIVQTNALLKSEIQEFLRPNGLEFLLDTEIRRMTVVQKTQDLLLSFPLHLIPDTFQRYIFHLAAILSNKDSVLLLEEPETHSYAPFVYQLAQHIINDDRNNQYFLTTHNPYLLTPIMQEIKDVAIFVTWFENYQTHARRLSEEEIREMLDDGVDIFMNLEQFIPA